MAQRIVDPLFTSGLEYAMSVAGGQNVPNMIAPGVSYSSEFPMGYTANGAAPPPMPVPMPATLEDFQRVDPFAALNAQLSDSLANPTSAMYSTDVGTGASMGLGSPMPISAPNTFRTGELEFTDYANPLRQSDPSAIADQMALTNIYSDIDSVLANARDIDAYNEATDGTILSELKSFLSGSTESKMTDAMADRLIEELNARAINNNDPRSRLSTDPSSTMGFTQGNFGPGATVGGLGGGVSTRGSAADMNAAMTAGMARDKASAMNTLYGGAGSSFESGRNEYTESGQYDIDKAARDAAFDAMREQRRIDAGLPSIRLTPEETQQAVQELQASIGFGGAMTPRGRNRIPAMAAEPVPQPVKGYTPFDFANIQSILNNLG